MRPIFNTSVVCDNDRQFYVASSQSTEIKERKREGGKGEREWKKKGKEKETTTDRMYRNTDACAIHTDVVLYLKMAEQLYLSFVVCNRLEKGNIQQYAWTLR